MKKIAYLLHRFPRITDTFIRREIRSLQKVGTDVCIISVWKPGGSETTAAILNEWSVDTHFLLPASQFSIARTLLISLVRFPIRFVDTLRLAFSTSRPGFRGLAYQLFYFMEAVLAADIIRRKGICHVHNHIGDQSGTVTMLAANFAKIGYSITFHGWPVFFDAEGSRIKEKVLGANFTRAISYFCRSQLMMFSGSNDLTLFKVIHCGLDLDKYRYRPPAERISSVFCAARLSPEKGLEFLIHALKLLLNQGHELELRIAGDGPRREELARLTTELELADRVHFLGFLDEDEIIRELQACDLFVLPSFVEGLPVSAIEAMAIGVPVIATNIAGTSELVEHGKTGLLVRPSDSQALSEAIVRLITDYVFRLSIAELGRKKVSDEFDVAKESAKLNVLFLESCNSLKNTTSGADSIQEFFSTG
jgi:colanic acid/amylovoran biosynthesis glycosyltransferase